MGYQSTVLLDQYGKFIETHKKLECFLVSNVEDVDDNHNPESQGITTNRLVPLYDRRYCNIFHTDDYIKHTL